MHTGQQFLEVGIGLGLLRLSERGGVSFQEILPTDCQVPKQFFVQKSRQINDMEVAAPNLQEHMFMLGARYYTQVNMHDKYNGML